MPFDPATPYNELPDLPPPVELETRAVLKACIKARAELARLDAEAAQFPNPAILVGSMTLFEARDSSAIENIVTAHDALFRQVQLESPAADPATKEALRYRDALFQACRDLREMPVCTRMAVNICSIIKGAATDIRKVPGTTLRDATTGAVIYTPPIGEDLLRRKMANWERFMHERADLDPLVRLAVQHYQFEAIHPFLDGNGRTVRILNIVYLIEQDLLRLPILYLSREVLEHKTGYYAHLSNVTTLGNWHAWIEFVLSAVELSATRSQNKVMQIKQLMLETERYLLLRSRRLPVKELLEVLFTQPYCRIANLVDTGIAKRQAASTYLRALVDIGVLREVKVGREKLFLHSKFQELLTTDGSGITQYPPANMLKNGGMLFPSPPTA